jgi:hypothetical protein
VKVVEDELLSLSLLNYEKIGGNGVEKSIYEPGVHAQNACLSSTFFVL